ncbi:MAG: PEP-utilizing enzyme [Patescibacteria group bacterium]|jgi:phosphohistidine swiveling domain-containing protein
MNKNHYYKTEVVKVGKWALLPLDGETWFGNKSSDYFKEHFGIYKGGLYVFSEGLFHGYLTKDLFQNLKQRILNINKRDYKSLEKKLKFFYSLKKASKIAIAPVSKLKYSELSNKKLANRFLFVRDCIRRVTIFDQFGFVGEDFLLSLAEEVLVNKLGLLKNSSEYNRVLFVLTKPEKISTTLSEKRDTLKQAIEIKRKKINLERASKKMAKSYGWMPVFCYGEPWDEEYYHQELKSLISKNLKEVEKEYFLLKNYRQNRNNDIAQIVKKYNIQSQDLQKFIDFGLALDGRNEAEYFVSFSGFYLLPLYREIAKRLNASINQIRLLFEDELVACLLGKKDIGQLLQAAGKMRGFGFNKSMSKRFIFLEQEAVKMFKYIEKNSANAQGNDESQGICASPGRARGKIKIVSSPDENNKVKDGDILVTHATTVDYLPAMKRAVAIITEVGGLTCHAAVVSREFRIPCIIALKNAMHNLKDGDFVEVDADKGTVRILKG